MYRSALTTLATVLLALITSHRATFVQAQEDNTTSLTIPPYIGPIECPNDSGTIGYDNTTTLHIDTFHDARAVLNSKGFLSEYKYILCPNTVFDFGSNFEVENFTNAMEPLLPLMSNTTYSCGFDGSVDNNCVISGGHVQVAFHPDIILEEVAFKGVTFANSGGIAIQALGNFYSHAFFIDCMFKGSRGLATVYVHYDAGRSDRRALESKYEFNEELLSRIVSLSGSDYDGGDLPSLLYEINSPSGLDISIDWIDRHAADGEGRKLQTADGMAVYFYKSTLTDNIEKEALVYNVNGFVHLIDSDVTYNEAGFATMTNLYGAWFAMEGNCHFESNYDKKGPVFIDRYSRLVLNEEVSGVSNSGGNSGKCDIFMEDLTSEDCRNEETSNCVGTCCSFGDTSCDYITDKPTSTPVVVGEGKGNEWRQNTIRPGFDTPTPPPGEYETTTDSLRSGSIAVDEGCGTGCVATSVIVPVVVVSFIAVAVVFFRRRSRGSEAPPSGLELTEAAIDA